MENFCPKNKDKNKYDISFTHKQSDHEDLQKSALDSPHHLSLDRMWVVLA